MKLYFPCTREIFRETSKIVTLVFLNLTIKFYVSIGQLFPFDDIFVMKFMR